MKISLLKTWIVLLCMFGVLGYAQETHYERPVMVSQEIWDQITPYLLPMDHPAKPFLDATFSASRVIYDCESLRDAGFVHTPVQGLHATVVRHPNLPGYIIKVYLDTVAQERCDWRHWIKRISGANLIRDRIVKKKWQSRFKVARKWIYPLPNEPVGPDGNRNFILIVEDMNLLSRHDSHQKWHQLNDTKVLRDFHDIIRTLGLRDCARAANAPWSSDGRLVFVDTEAYNDFHINYDRLNVRLNPEMLRYWKKITKQ